MNNAFALLVSFALTASVAMTAALLLSSLLRTRASAKSVYAAWLVVLIAILIPVRFSPAPAPVTLKAEYAQAISQPIAPRPVAETPSETQREPAAYTPAFSAQQAAETLPGLAVSKTLEEKTAPRVTITWGTAILIVYAAGALAAAFMQTLRHLRYMRLIRRWEQTPEERTLKVYEQEAQALSLRRVPKLRVCRAAETPMVVGLARPRIVLPDERFNLQELRLVLRHELTHYKRGDIPVKLLQTVAKCLHWYNPLMYLMNKEMNYACEASCDERVMRGQDMDTREYYSETIIAVIRRQSGARTALSTTFYGGKKGMKKRILSIMDMKRRRLGALILCPVLLICIMFSVAFASEPPKSTNEPAMTSVADDSLAALFNETGDIMNEKTAGEEAIDHYHRYRANSLETACKVTSYEIKDVTYGRLQLETAIVDLCVTFNHEGQISDSNYRVYMTPRGGTLIRLVGLSEGQNGLQPHAAAYYDHPNISFGAETKALQATMPRYAYINNPVAACANMSNMKTDYDWPQGVLFNGAPVVVDEVDHEGNNCRMLSDAVTIYWAHVTVGTVSGWMPLSTMTFEDELIGEVAALPTGKVIAYGQTGHASIYRACSRDTAITSVAGGTQVELLGFFASYYQVRLSDGTTGFIPKENVGIDESVQALIAANTPKNYDKIQPGGEEAYEAYTAAISALWDEYGDSNEWPLEIKARASQIRLDYGFDVDMNVNILPGENDMSQEEALAQANALVEKEFGIPATEYTKMFISLYYKPEAPDVHIWSFRYFARVGERDCWVRFDQEGNLVESGQMDYVNRSAYTEDQLKTLLQQAGWYADNGIDLGKVPDDEAAALMDAAFDTFTLAYPEEITREECTITCRLMRDASGELPAETRWQIVTIVPTADHEKGYGTLYHFVNVNGQIYSTDIESYRLILKAQQTQYARETLEQERGRRFFAWTVEEKAAFAAQFSENEYALPPEGAISQEQAYAAALPKLIAAVGEEDAKAYQAFFSYALFGAVLDNNYQWRVDFYTAAEMVEGMALNGYIVWVDPMTGTVTDVWGPEGNG